MTFSVAASADDGNVDASAATYPPTSAGFATTNGVSPVRRQLGAGTYTVGLMLVRWNTSTLPPNVTVTGAILRIYVQSQTTADGRALVAEWYATTNWPIDSPDYTSTAPNTPVASRAISTLTASAQNDLPLTDLTGINPTGYTGMRLHISGSTPTGTNSVNIAHYDSPSLPEPQLIITYAPPLQLLTGTVTGTATTTARYPGTFSVTAPADDGYVNSASLVDVTGNGLVVQRENNGGLSSNSVALIRFDSSALPDNATITSAWLRLYLATSFGGAGNPNFDLVGEYYSASNWPIDVGDYTGTAPVAPLFSRASVSLLGQKYYDFPFTDFSGIAVAGYTGFRLHISTAAFGFNTGVTVASGETANGPFLVVNFAALKPLSGTATGTATASAQLSKGAYLITGAITGQGVLSASLHNTTHLAGASTGRASLQASLAVATHLAGTTAGAVTIAGVLNPKRTMVASATATGVAVGALAVIHRLTAATQGAAAAIAVLNPKRTMRASLIGLGTTTGALNKSAYLITGTVIGRGVLLASLHNTTHLTGAAAGLASLQATVVITRHLAGTATGAVTTGAVLKRTIAIGASVAGAATANAGLRVTHHLQAAPIGQGRVDGLLSLPMFIEGALRGTAVSAASITHVVHVAAVVMASATATATSHIFKNMVGSPTGQAVVTANLRISHVRLFGVITGQAVVISSLRIAHRMQGFTIGTATAQATMGPVNHLSGVVTATAITVVVLRHIVHARGLVYGQAYTSAVLMWVNIQTIHCEPLTGVHDAPGCTGLSPVATISQENLVTLHTIGK